MRKISIILCTLIFILFQVGVCNITAQPQHKAVDSIKKKVELNISEEGFIEGLIFHTDWGINKVDFNKEKYRGPSFGDSISLSKDASNPLLFEGEKEGIKYSLEYVIKQEELSLLVEIENATADDFSPKKVPFYLGIDTYMDTFPEWNQKYFPTFFRCEANNFWGYMMTPTGKILSITSPDPIASYQIYYLQEAFGHYIHTVSLDLLCQPPLPDTHPYLSSIKPNAKRSWEISLQPVNNLEEVLPLAALKTRASMIELSTYSQEPFKEVTIRTVGADAKIEVIPPSGIKKEFNAENNKLIYKNTEAYGLYDVKSVNAEGKIATASFYVRPSWSWYIKRAREMSLHCPPRAERTNDCCELWYQLFGFYLAEKHFPDPSLKFVADEMLDEVLTEVFEEKDGMINSNVYIERLQNVSSMVSVLAVKYSADKDMKTLETASKCADYILSRQHEKGYYGGYGMHHYTSVIYIAKSMIELTDQIEELAKTSPYWKSKYDLYQESIRRAMDELSMRGRNISTEGQQTYEDGAVSCSAAQLMLYALKQDGESAEKYMKPGLDYLIDHACLTRLLDPDCRSRGATLRFWESWADIRTPMQAMLSPHGWSGWRIYATYYSYLLTGDYERLIQLFDAVGTCTQLISFPDGKSHYAFTPDPQFEGYVRLPDETNNNGKLVKKTLTRGYVDLIGNWFGKRTPGDGYIEKMHWDWDGGGLLMEIFKAMEETVLTNAFVCEKENGEFLAYNCTVETEGNKLVVIPSEDVISNVHFNLKNKKRVKVLFGGGLELKRSVSGMTWLRNNN